jgi:DNA-binding response OmpR family regulator
MTTDDRPRVLVVHAPSAFRDALVASLQKTEYVVELVGTVPEGLQAYERTGWAAVIAGEDLGPRSGGWMLEWMKVLRPDVVTVLLATKLDGGTERKLDVVVQLPVPPAAVVTRLARTLRDNGRELARQPTPTPAAMDHDLVWGPSRASLRRDGPI